MGVFDILSFGADSALGARPNYSQYYQDDQTNMKLLNEQTTRIEQETRDAAERMKRVQLTTGKGVNSKLQSYYDGLTEEMKQVIAKNPNYRTDPFQMQQVNAVMDRFSNNDIIGNDLQSKAAYQQFKDAATKGILTAREIADGEQRWKRYQDGLDDVFGYSKARQVDYDKEAISASAALRQLNLKKGHMLNVKHSDHRRAMQAVFANPDNMDQLVADFKNTLPASEQAKWLGLPVKEHMTDEDEAELSKQVQQRIADLSSNKALADPLIDWASDRFYPFTNQQYDQWDMINQRNAWHAGRTSSKTPKLPPNGYFKEEIGNKLGSIDPWMKAHPDTKSATFDIKMNATSALFKTNNAGVLTSNRMFIRTTDGHLIRMHPTMIGYLQGYKKGLENTLTNGMISAVKMKDRNGEVYYQKRVAASTQGFIPDTEFRNFITSLGYYFGKNKNQQWVVKGPGIKDYKPYGTNPDEAIRKFMIEYFGAQYIPKQAGGVSGMIYQPAGMVIPYSVETDSDINNSSIEKAYDQEVFMKKKKYQLDADAAAMNAGYYNGDSSPYSGSDVSFSQAPVAQ